MAMTESIAAEAPPAPFDLAGFKTFGLLWVGQMVSMIGSGLTRFALGVWVYQRTGSVTQFAVVTMCASLPALALSPLAGALIDRWDRRRVMIANNMGASLGTLAFVALLWHGAERIWHVYVIVVWGSLISAFELPTLIAVTSLLVPRRHLGRANGMLQFGQAVTGVVAPLAGGLMLVSIGLAGVVLVDFATFAFALAVLGLVRFPRPKVSAEGLESRGSLWREAAMGWSFIHRRAGLWGLLLYFAMLNLVLAIVTVLVTPMVLSFATAEVLGRVLASAGTGLVLGSVLMTVTGGPRRRIRGVLASGLVFGAAMAAVGLRPSAPLIAGGLFVMMLAAPFVNGCSQAIWQSKVPPDIQGRVFAVRRMIGQFTAPIGYLAAGPLADFVFEPLMAEGGALAPTVGALIGVGPGRGIGLIALCLAVLPLLFTLWAWAQPPIRRIEDELPDAVS
jgi:MFS family permease